MAIIFGRIDIYILHHTLHNFAKEISNREKARDAIVSGSLGAKALVLLWKK